MRKSPKAQAALTLARAKFEAGDYPRNLLTQNSKVLKSGRVHQQFVQYGLQMAPAKMSGHNLCPHSTPECERDCLAFSGHGSALMHEAHQKFNPIWATWILKALIYRQDRAWFFGKLMKEIEACVAKADRDKKSVVLRLNVTSDIVWERQRIPLESFEQAGIMMPGPEPTLLQVFPDIQFIDYTKIPGRRTPANYRLSMSYSGHNRQACLEHLARGGTVSAVFTEKPKTYAGYPVIDGDKHDLRHIDPPGVWVGLKPKGTLLRNLENNPFVVHPLKPIKGVVNE